MDNFLSSVDFNFILQSTIVHFIWTQLRELVVESCHQFLPVIPPSDQKHDKWFTPGIRPLYNKIHKKDQGLSHSMEVGKARYYGIRTPVTPKHLIIPICCLVIK